MNTLVSTLLVADVIWERRRRLDWLVVLAYTGVAGFVVAGWLAVVIELRYA